ncbi:MAG: DNA replication/repair protein RecF [Candidatus Dojkabacteria bacterium]
MLNNIKIKNFRNFETFKTEFSEKINLIIEPNGSGKTNFLEAIYLSVFGTSFKTISSSEDFIKKGNEECFVSTEWNDSIDRIDFSFSKKSARSFKLNSKKVPRKKFLGVSSLVLFAPHSVDITGGEPAVRRRDLDDYLRLLYEPYNSLLSSYTKVLKNRNAVIKAIREHNAEKKQLLFWSEKLAELAEKIRELRGHFFCEIMPFVKLNTEKLYHSVKGLEIKYLPNVNNVSFFDKYQENVEKEIIVGKTLYGTHKDDYTFLFFEDESDREKKNLRHHGSRGQQRVGSFLFKVAQFDLLKQKKGKGAIFLIDDIMSELDEQHRIQIAEFIIQLEAQTFLTGPDVKEIPQSLQINSNRIKI